MATKTLSPFGLPTTKQARVAIKLNKWLEKEAKIIEKMITDRDIIYAKQQEMYSILCEPQLYPEVAAIVNTCISQVSLALDGMAKEIREAQMHHMENVRRAGEIVKAIKN